MKLIFSAVLAAMLITSSRANAANAGATMNPPNAKENSSGTNTDALTALFGDPVVAKGNGFEIKQSDLDQVMTGIKSALAARGQDASQEQLTRIEGTMLDRLIQVQLLLQKSTAADKAEGKKKADAQLATLLEQAGSQEAFDRRLKALGMSADDLRSRITQEATATAALARELGVNVTEAEANEFYTNHPADFEYPETAHVRHILILTMDPLTRQPLSSDAVKAKRAQIDDILKRARAGEDFAALATQYSEDTGSKDKGGELEFPRGNPGVPPELEAAAFSLNTNQISDVVTLSIGYDIVKLLNIIPAKTEPFAGVDTKVAGTPAGQTVTIKDILTAQKMDGPKTQKYLQGLKKEDDVQILDADLKAAVAAAEAAASTNEPAAMQ